MENNNLKNKIMTQNAKSNDIFKRDVSTICKYLGGFYAIFGAVSLVLMILYTPFLSIFEDTFSHGFTESLEAIRKVNFTYFPFIILLGLLYLWFSNIHKNNKKYSTIFNTVLTILSILWIVFYTKSLINILDILISNNDIYIQYTYALLILGYLTDLVMFTVPQYILSKKLKTEVY